MGSSRQTEFTGLLVRWHDGDRSAMERIFPLVYRELHRMAGNFMRAEKNNTLQTTALIHEAYLRLVESEQQTVGNRRHFFSLAARAMRQTLVDRARARLTRKRGGEMVRIELSEWHPRVENSGEALLALDAALGELATLDPRKARVAELKLFGGFTLSEAAKVLEVSSRTVERDWRIARAWLRGQLGDVFGR